MRKVIIAAAITAVLSAGIAYADSTISAYINPVDTTHQYYFLSATSTVQSMLTTGFQEIILHASSTSGAIISDQGSDTSANFLSYFDNAGTATNLGNFVAGGGSPQSDGTYYMVFYSCSTGGSGAGFACGTQTEVGYTELTKSGTSWTASSVITDHSTHIISNTVLDGTTPETTVSTTTNPTFQVFGELNAAQHSTTVRVHISIAPTFTTQQDALAGPISAFGNTAYRDFYIPIDPAGAFSGTQSFLLSTTTTPFTDTGVYVFKSSIEEPNSILGFTSIFGIGFGVSTYDATTTQFTVGTTTSFQDELSQVINSYTALSATSTQSLKDSCSPFSGSFDVGTCLLTLFLPSSSDFSSLFQTMKDSVFSVVPIGYVTRTIVLLSGGATSTLPTFAATVPAGYPGAGVTLDLTPWNDLMGTSSIISTATSTDGKTLREIIEPGWDTFVYVVFALAVFFELWGIEFKAGGGDKLPHARPPMRG